MRILILDCHKNRIHESEKIAKALQRTEGVEVDILEIRKLQFPNEYYDAYVISGADGFSQKHLWVRKVREFVRELIDAGQPVLGVCFGNQLLASIYNREVREAEEPEVGWYDVELTEEGIADPLFEGLPRNFPVFQYHKKFVEASEGILAGNENGVQAVRYGENVWGIQFHPEETPDSGVWFLMNSLDPIKFKNAITAKPEKYIEWRVYENFVITNGTSIKRRKTKTDYGRSKSSAAHS